MPLFREGVTKADSPWRKIQYWNPLEREDLVGFLQKNPYKEVGSVSQTDRNKSPFGKQTLQFMIYLIDYIDFIPQKGFYIHHNLLSLNPLLE